jgi:hypothetical protein
MIRGDFGGLAIQGVMLLRGASGVRDIGVLTDYANGTDVTAGGGVRVVAWRERPKLGRDGNGPG